MTTIKPLVWEWKKTKEDGEYWRSRVVFGNVFNDGLNVHDENVFCVEGRWVAGSTGRHAATAHEAKNIVESFHVAALKRFLDEAKEVQE